ncbi:MAG: SusC/RagA family TonB-linked outer membrane protein [Haliscomenobacter sp.]|nr:SusC/RagA family TonB-linked outer membrane protein [Haliscomenobacter sp.]
MKFQLNVQSQWALLKVCFLTFGVLLSMSAFAQRTLTGKVMDAANSQPIIGANLLVKGSSNGAVTDIDGTFTMKLSDSETVLVVTYVGYDTKEVEVAGLTTIEISLEEAALGLSEVTVTALGITKEKVRVTTAIQSVDGEQLIKAREPNNIQGLTGKIAGLTIGSSPEMLRRPNVLLRGASDLLYVVDGVPINSDTWNINPDDIETFTVLKGATAAALYGFRGKNGAILITTKRGVGKNLGFSVEFNSSTMVEAGFNAIPKVQDLYGPGDHGIYEFVDGRGGGKNDGDYDIWGPPLDGRLLTQYDSPIDPATGKRIPTPFIPRGKDNLTRFLQPGLLTTNSVSVSSSGDRYDMRFSVGHSYQKGVVPNTSLNISNFNATLGFDFTDRLRFESNINFNRQFSDNYPDVNYGPNSLIYNMIIWGGADWDVDDMKQIWQEGQEGVQQIYAEYQRYNNPWFVAKEWLRGHYKNDVFGYASLSYEISDALKLTGRSSVTTYDLFRTEKMPYSAGAYGRDERKGDYREDRRTLFENNTDILLQYDKRFNGINLSAVAGGNVRTFAFNSNYGSTDYLITPGVYSFSNSLNPARVFSFESNMTVLSGYYSTDITLGRYMNLSHTGRVDKISTLPEGNQTFYYPSFGANSIVTEYLPLGPVSFLKLRGAYANVKDGLISPTVATAAAPFTGNPLEYGDTYRSSYDGPSYGNATVYSTSLAYGNVPASYFTNTLGNPDLERNSRSEYELGFDLGLLTNRVNVEFTYFNIKEGPRTFARPISETTGYTGQLVNGITTRKKGLEIVLKADPFKASASKLKWLPMINFSTFRETYESFYKDAEGKELEKLDDYSQQIGRRVDEYWVSNGYFFTPDGQIINDNGGRPIRLSTVNGNARKLLGYLDPDFVWSFINRFSYKNFTVSFQFDGRQGGVIYNYIQRQTFRGGRHISTVEGAMGVARLEDTKGNRTWVGSGVQIANSAALKSDIYGNITNLSELQFTPNTTATFLQDWISRYYQENETNMMDRSFAKLREVVISYNVPVKPGSFFREMTISLIGRNLLYFAEKKDIDLDAYVGRSAGTDIETPTSKRYGVNFSFKF